MVTKGSSSAYTAWVHMENEPGEYVISYKNVGKRFVKLAEHGIIKEIRLKGVVNLHGRKDYVVTMKGFELLISYFLDHPETIQSIVVYINRFEVDKYRFALLLKEGYVNSIETLNEYNKHTNSLYYPFGIDKIEEIKDWYEKHWDVHENNKKIHQRMMLALNQLTADQKVYEKILVAQRKMLEDIKSVKGDMNSLTAQFKAEDSDREEINKVNELNKLLDETKAVAKEFETVRSMELDSELEEMHRFSKGTPSRKEKPT